MVPDAQDVCRISALFRRQTDNSAQAHQEIRQICASPRHVSCGTTGWNVINTVENRKKVVMNSRFTSGLVLALLVSVPVGGSAQSRTSEHGFAIGLGGATSTEVTAPFFGASAGFNVANHLQITADVGRMQDVLADFTNQDLTSTERTVNALYYTPYGASMSASVKMPTNYVTGGIRVPFVMRNNVRPYVALSGGLAHMSPAPSIKITYAATTQDITDEVMQNSRAGCAWTESAVCATPALREETRPMASAGAGLAVLVARHLTFDFGYKYSGIFIQRDYLQDVAGSPHDHKRIDMHRFYAGAGVAF
jgi:opacity protein-like surface antigen